MGRESTKNEGIRSAAARDVAPATRGDGLAGRAPRFGRRSSRVVVGRTIGEKREKLETKNERAAARKKDKQKYWLRVIMVSLGFVILITILIVLAITFLRPDSDQDPITTPEPVITEAEPTIEIIDGSTSAAANQITSRMRNYVGLVESDLKSYHYQPTKAVIPAESIREVDFYLEGYNGYFKTTIDRDAGVITEDIDRMLRYLAGQGITDFEYVDVRIDGRAFWK